MGEFRMPSLGADMADGTLRKWLVKSGDRVKRGDIIAEVETQKGIIDIEVFEDGIVGEIKIRENEKVPVGTVLTYLSPLVEPIETVQLIPLPRTDILNQKVRASPLARKIADQHELKLEGITGTGPLGAVVKDDVEREIERRKSVSTEPQQKVMGMRNAIAEAMSKSQQEIPPYNLRTVVDVKACMNHLMQLNKNYVPKDRVLLIAVFLKAIGIALKEFPELNGWWENGFVGSKEITVGTVISLRTGGIVVPAITRVNDLDLIILMKKITQLILGARSGHLKSSEMTRPGITVTNLGETGVESITGIIYPPQVALIGIGGITEKPWAVNGMLTTRPTVEFTLTADHRATDGIYGSRFLSRVSEILSNPEGL